MNILVTLDSNYIPQLIAMLNSVQKNNAGTAFDVYIAHSTLCCSDIARVQRALPQIKLHPIKLENNLFAGAHYTKRITREAYYRVLMSEYLPKELDRILYLDPDTIIIKPLDKLYNYDFGNKCFIAAGHTHGAVEWFNKKRLKMGRTSQYINSGVLMVNLDNLRRVFSPQLVFDYVHRQGRRLFQADQDVINALFHKYTIYVCAELYNLDERTFRRNVRSLSYVSKNTVIIHYDGRNKPWLDGYRGMLDCYYNYYSSVVFGGGKVCRNLKAGLL
ncbi:MAG: glycosyltransferase family 8 protein [Clostridiales bacterium]|nr:glycosyltransferase family 8 protein [Clostridiales bacterium]